MKLAELFPEGGRGVIGTADATGMVNQAVFATPHVIDDETLAWGFADGRSYRNLLQNPHASFLYLAPTRGYSGWRLTLTLKEMGEGELEQFRAEAEQKSIEAAGPALRHVGYFKVEEVRPLV